MSSDVAIRVTDVGKRYLIYERPEDRLKQMIVSRLQRAIGRPPRCYFRDFAALNGISFEIGHGETVGIIGRNGSGKSTLLQIVCGTLRPSSGSVQVNGRIAALLELGAGFNPEFTGRENVYLNAAILGLLRAEVDARFDDIACFADIGVFIDQPVKTYSSGMFVRLAFAVAINVDPDILVVDEALAVGDEAFQRKCFARIEGIKEKGGTILFVSHGAQTIVQLCDRAMLIDRGEMILEGRPKTVVSQYQRYVNLAGAEAEPVREEIKAMDGWGDAKNPLPIAADVPEMQGRPQANANETGGPEKFKGPSDDESWFDPGLVSETTVPYRSGLAEIRDVRIETLDGRAVNNLVSGARYRCIYTVHCNCEATDIAYGMLIKTAQGIELCGANTEYIRRERISRMLPGEKWSFEIVFNCRLRPGTYFLNAGLMGYVDGNRLFLDRQIDAIAFRVIGDRDVLAYGFFDLDPTVQSELVSTE